MRHVHLQGLGEPLLSPKLEAILRLGAAHGVTFATVSNGSVLTAERIGLVLEHFTHYTVSIDSSDPQLFDRLRPGVGLAKIVDGVTSLIRERNASRAATKVGINFVVSHVNAHELDILDRFAVSLGADYINVMDVSAWLLPGDEGYDEAAAFLAEARARHGMVREKVEALAARSAGALDFVNYMESGDLSRCCPLPFSMAYVSARGDVLPCCMFKVICASRALRLGSLEDDAFPAVWNGEPFQRLRSMILQGGGDLPWKTVCGTCPY